MKLKKERIERKDFLNKTKKSKSLHIEKKNYQLMLIK